MQAKAFAMRSIITHSLQTEENRNFYPMSQSRTGIHIVFGGGGGGGERGSVKLLQSTTDRFRKNIVRSFNFSPMIKL